MKLLTRPLPYVIWAVLVVVALASTAGRDPYVFALACFLTAALSGLIAISAVAVVILAKQLRWPARAGILGSILVTGVALAAAFAHLGTFNWA